MSDITKQLHNSEWLSKIMRRLNLAIPAIVICFGVLSLGTDILLALRFKAWLPSAVSNGLAAEPAALLYDGLLQPILIGYFCWLQKAAGQLFGNLSNEGIVESNTHLSNELTKCKNRLQNKWLTLIAIIASLFFVAWLALSFTAILFRPSYPSWLTVHPAITLGRAPFVFVAFYALVIVVYDLVVIVFTLNNLFRHQRIHVEPFHPDGAGGLGSVGQFSANLGYGIGVMGLAISISIIQAPSTSVVLNDYAILLAVALYIACAPAIFFIPLWAAHHAMTEYRRRLLMELSTEFDSAFKQLHNIRSSSAEQIEPYLKRIQQLKEARTITSQFPVWPFNTGSLRRFFGLVLSPLLPGALSIIIDLGMSLLRVK